MVRHATGQERLGRHRLLEPTPQDADQSNLIHHKGEELLGILVALARMAVAIERTEQRAHGLSDLEDEGRTGRGRTERGAGYAELYTEHKSNTPDRARSRAAGHATIVRTPPISCRLLPSIRMAKRKYFHKFKVVVLFVAVVSQLPWLL